MAERIFLAVDMGASSGRHVAGRFDGRKLQLEEVYRFDNGPVNIAGSLFWDLPNQWSHVLAGLRAAASRFGSGVTSVGVDTWGVDFGLLGRDDVLLGNPYHYRDARTNGMMEKAFSLVPREEIFRHTGLQFMQFNTLYQFLAMKLSGSPLLDIAETLLMVPDLFHWLLTGRSATSSPTPPPASSSTRSRAAGPRISCSNSACRSASSAGSRRRLPTWASFASK